MSHLPAGGTTGLVSLRSRTAISMRLNASFITKALPLPEEETTYCAVERIVVSYIYTVGKPRYYELRHACVTLPIHTPFILLKTLFIPFICYLTMCSAYTIITIHNLNNYIYLLGVVPYFLSCSYAELIISTETCLRRL